jgi:5-methylcytosine-specific restriction endonuclease McrA
MPSSPGYKRNYTQEWATAKKRNEDDDNAARHRLRRKAVKLGMVKPNDGKDVDHVVALKKGGANTISNARVRSPSENRSFPRNSKGGMIRNVPKKK